MVPARFVVAAALATLLSALLALSPVQAQAPATSQIQTPEQFLGFKVGADGKLARWDKIVQYMQLVATGSDRVRVQELGKTTNGNPFISVEIGAPDTLRNIDRYKQLERKLYFQGDAPTDAERQEIFQSGKAVVVVTCNIHSSEIGSSQMAIELVYRLATENSPLVRRILDNVILVLVPSLNPDGQILVTDWYNKNVGTEYETSAMPWLYHPYVGHDNNRDAYMLTQTESQLVAKLLWHDWFPSIWLDEHQQGNSGARIFVMPATDPINPNVHPLIYRWNGILGQAQGAALEAAGKDGIIYNATYTNFWEGAMAWAGWWHNEVGLLTEVASVRIASPTEQQRAELGRPPAAPEPSGEGRGRGDGGGILPPPRDVMPRTEYPRPWLGGRWTLRDIVDYELIATVGLLEAAGDRRETILRHIYEVNRATIDNGRRGDPAAILIPLDHQQDGRQAVHLAEKLQMGGVDVYRAEAPFEADGKAYEAGTFVIPMTQVFARYAKDMLEKQTYPEVRRTPASPPEPPYDVTAWSLGMLMGADTVFVKKPLAASVTLRKIDAFTIPKGEIIGNAPAYAFDYKGPDTALAINRMLKDGARMSFGPGQDAVHVTGITRKRLETIAAESGLTLRPFDAPKAAALPGTAVRAPRVALYQSWTAAMDEGWTRWVLEQYEFAPRTIHNEDVRAGKLRDKFDVIVLADQQPRDIVEGNSSRSARKEYQGGIGQEGLAALKAFVADGGTLVALGNSCDLAIENWPLPVRNVKRGLSRDQHFAPGTIVRVQSDTVNPLAFGVAADSYGFYNNSPFFSIADGFPSLRTSVLVRYPNRDVVASGWLKGEEFMAGQAAVVVVDSNPGRIVLFGLRPQHRAQTQAMFPLLFNALYLSTGNPARGRTN
jgi:hypothetical protein